MPKVLEKSITGSLDSEFDITDTKNFGKGHYQITGKRVRYQRYQKFRKRALPNHWKASSISAIPKILGKAIAGSLKSEFDISDAKFGEMVPT